MITLKYPSNVLIRYSVRSAIGNNSIDFIEKIFFKSSLNALTWQKHLYFIVKGPRYNIELRSNI